MKQLMKFHINGDDYEIAVDINTTLLEVLREDLHLTGAKTGCNEGDCGACTVLVDDQPVASCTTLAAEVQGREITTIEGLATKDGSCTAGVCGQLCYSVRLLHPWYGSGHRCTSERKS